MGRDVLENKFEYWDIGYKIDRSLSKFDQNVILAVVLSNRNVFARVCMLIVFSITSLCIACHKNIFLLPEKPHHNIY